MSRFFQVLDRKTVTLPQGLQAGPGATHLRCEAGCVVELDDDRCVQFSRFLNGRVRNGDLVELTAEQAAKVAPAAPAPKLVAQPDPTKPLMDLDLSKPSTAPAAPKAKE